jgi:glycolate oxidase iron-sulfur subunit
MRAMWENKLPPTPKAFAPIDRCLGCLACETACPSHVPYGDLLEKTRAAKEELIEIAFWKRLARAFILKFVFTSTLLMEAISLGFRIAQKIGIKSSYVPRFSGHSFKLKWNRKHGILTFAKSQKENGEPKIAGIFTGCVLDVAEEPIAAATVQLLELAGLRIFMPTRQTCCGAIHSHAGDPEIAKKCWQTNLEAFCQAHCDYIVTNSAGCLRQLKQSCRAEVQSPMNQKLLDIVELLSEHTQLIQMQKWKRTPIRVLYDSPCHLIHGQGSIANLKTVAFLQKLPAVTVEMLPDHEYCCGAAGIYVLTQPRTSQLVLSEKMKAIHAQMTQEPKPYALITGNPGCIFQLRGGVAEDNIPLKVLHPVEFIGERLMGV